MFEHVFMYMGNMLAFGVVGCRQAGHRHQVEERHKLGCMVLLQLASYQAVVLPTAE